MPVKCADCGYLGARLKTTREIVEAEGGMRAGWNIPERALEGGKGLAVPVYEITPICFARQIDFDSGDGAIRLERAANNVARERECSHFTPWSQGFSPREHFEMIQQKGLREWQERRDEADRVERLARERRDDEREKRNQDFQAAQAELTRQHNDRSLAMAAAEAEHSRSYATKSLLVSIIGVVVAVGGLLLTSLIEYWKETHPSQQP